MGRYDGEGLTRRKTHEANETEPKTPDKASCVDKGGLCVDAYAIRVASMVAVQVV